MKKSLIAVCLSVCLVLGISTASMAEGDFTGNLNLIGGGKFLDSGDWEPLETQTEGGVEFDIKKQEWPVSFSMAFLYSSADDTISVWWLPVEVEGKTTELRFGVRKIWEESSMIRPFLGGGLAIISAEIEGRSPWTWTKVSESDTGPGAYLEGGLYWTLADHLNLGFEVGYSYATVTFGDEDGNAGGLHAGLLAGYHW
ncbi:MAG: outer membrane beta-barrel protein [Thermodesulfobacteriota bacterium]